MKSEAVNKIILTLVVLTILETIIGFFLVNSIWGLEGGPSYSEALQRIPWEFAFSFFYLTTWILLLRIGKDNLRVIRYSIIISGINLLFVIAAFTRNSLLRVIAIIFTPIISPLAPFSQMLELLLFIVFLWFLMSLNLYSKQRKRQKTGN